MANGVTKVVNILEKHLVELGFKKESSTELVDGEPSFYYYVYGKRDVCTLISSANDELINGRFWYVELFEHPEYKPITELETLKELVSILNKISK